MLTVKKVKRLMFKISVNIETMKYNRDFFVEKHSYICFLGIPFYSTKHILVNPNTQDLINVSY